MINLTDYRKYEALGKARLIQRSDGVVEAVADLLDETGNPNPKSLGQIIVPEAQAEVDLHQAVVDDWKGFISIAFGDSAQPLTGMSRLEFLWGRFYQNEIVGAYTLAFTNGAIAAFLDAIRMSSPDDFKRYVVLQHPLVQTGVPMVLEALEQAGVIAQGQAAVRAAEVLNPEWVKPE